MPFDPKTFSLAVGLGNLIFALLATLYILRTRTSAPALATWRWARLFSGAGFLCNLASSLWPERVPPGLGNLLQTLAASLDIAAYCLLLEHRGWQRPLFLLVTVSLALQLGVIFSGGSHGLLLLVFSSIGVLYYSVLAALLLRAGCRDGLCRLMALVDLLMALVLLLRVGKGLTFAPLVRFDGDGLTLLLYLMLYLVVILNGFGFLLLAKQVDDERLQQALAALAEADAQRLELLTQASHEFRTPAALIQASLDSLRFLQDDLPPAVRQRLDNIRRATRRLTDLSNTLLAHDRLSRQSVLWQPEPVDLVELLRDALKLYPPEAGIVAELPSAPIVRLLDPTQWRIAIQNLVDNALEHNPPSSEPVSVILSQSAERVAIAVADGGRGIPEAEKPHLFERFHSRGTGLTRGVGLSIVQRVAQNHGGWVEVGDNHPTGTVITLHLPPDAARVPPSGAGATADARPSMPGA